MSSGIAFFVYFVGVHFGNASFLCPSLLDEKGLAKNESLIK